MAAIVTSLTHLAVVKLKDHGAARSQLIVNGPTAPPGEKFHAFQRPENKHLHPMLPLVNIGNSKPIAQERGIMNLEFSAEEKAFQQEG